ncbi:hypothetical protein K492DRAFT_238628 [Lichtheimia hyalospora FSU 10163]|nr:hypothetical protein K492DRAFT_238628 [Lichtheimia hyalospora FSU 10163]
MTSTGEWTVLEKLLLAQAVYKFGEDDWVHIARNLRQHTMLNRPPEFFNQKNCSLQYYLLIDELETEKRHTKSSAAAAQDMPPVVKLARQLYMQRIQELKHAINLDNQRFLELVTEIDAIRSGRRDKQLLAEMEKQGISTTQQEKSPPAEKQYQQSTQASSSTATTSCTKDTEIALLSPKQDNDVLVESQEDSLLMDGKGSKTTRDTRATTDDNDMGISNDTNKIPATNAISENEHHKRKVDTYVEEGPHDTKRMRMDPPSDDTNDISRTSSMSSFATAFTHQPSNNSFIGSSSNHQPPSVDITSRKQATCRTHQPVDISAKNDSLTMNEDASHHTATSNHDASNDTQ